MRIFKNIFFNKWAEQIGLTDETLKVVINEIAAGLYEASLGGNLFKKRIGIKGKGKRGGVRTIIAFKKEDKAFFMYGFAKNKKANIDMTEEKIYKKLAALLLSYSDKEVDTAVKNKEFIEVL